MIAVLVLLRWPGSADEPGRTPTASGTSTPHAVASGSAPGATSPSASAATGTPSSSSGPSVATPPGSPVTAALDAAYGRPEPAARDGSGEAVLSIPSGTRAGLLIVRHSGAGSMILEFNAGGGAPPERLLNVDGDYQGSLGFGLTTAASDGATVRITSSGGSWKVDLAPLSSAGAISDVQVGGGDQAFFVEGPVTLTVVHQGIGSFALTWTNAAGTEVLITDSGDLTQTVRVEKESGVLSVRSSGTWTLTSTRGNGK